MKWYHLIFLLLALFIGYFIGTQRAVIITQDTPSKIDYKPYLDSLIFAQKNMSAETQILRGIVVGYQKDNQLLKAQLIRISDKVQAYTTTVQDTSRYLPNIRISLPDSLFKQSAPIVIEKSKTYHLDIKDSTILIGADINRDSLKLTKIEIPNTLVINDEVFNINDEKQIRTTTISNSNPLLNTKPMTVINQNWSDKGIKKQKRKSFILGAGIAATMTFLLSILLK